MIERLEERFNVIYPDNENATYESILNYSTEKDNPFQRWYRYKEGFSVQFIQKVVEEYSKGNIKTLLDPFSGSGTTIIAANKLGCQGIGFEVNPFSYFLAKVKQKNYSTAEIEQFQSSYKQIVDELKEEKYEEYDLPKLSISNKVFQKQAEIVMMSCKEKIMKITDKSIQDLLLLGWLASIEELSEYRKAGNGLKKRKTVKPVVVDETTVIQRLIYQYHIMYKDLCEKEILQVEDNIIFNCSSIGFSDKISKKPIDGIIFSPPYANCFDYTEIYKLELWFGGFVESYEELKVLRSHSLRSHLNRKYIEEDIKIPSSTLNYLLDQLDNVELWDKRIPKMLRGYFLDMFNIIDNCFGTLREEGFCAIVVGNSAYGGIVFPTDLILAEYAEQIGFKVDKIEVDRYIITSSQQYKKTKQNGKYLRESVICLIK